LYFCWCTLEVFDLKKSLEFYENIVGLPVARRISLPDGRGIAFLGGGETRLELMETRKEGALRGAGVSLGFSVPSLDEKLRFVKERKFAVEGPVSPNPHTRFFFIFDPDGYKIQFVEEK